MKRTLITLICLVSLLAFAAFDFDGAFPKDIATGGSNMVLFEPEAFFQNTGMLSFIEEPQVQFSTARLYDVPELETVSFLFIKPAGPITLGFGFTSMGSSLYKEQQLQIGGALKVGKNFSFGTKVKYLSVVIDEIGSASEWALDLGIVYFVNYDLSIGIRLKNVSMPYIGQEYMPRDVSAGINYKIFKNLEAYFNAVYYISPSFLKMTYGLGSLTDEQEQEITDNIWDAVLYDQYLENFGAEKEREIECHGGIVYRIFDHINLMGGLKRVYSGRISYACGFELFGPGLSFSYAYDVHPELGGTHYFSFKIGERPVLKKLSVINGRIDINEASAEELSAIPGIGLKTAQNIVEYREKIGGFTSIGQLVNVTRIGEKTVEKIRPYVCLQGSADDEPVETKKAPTTRSGTGTPAGKNMDGLLVDINKASKSELMALPRVGEKTAENIINYRKQAGGFKTVEDIMNVTRIGEKTFENLKPYITVTPYDPAVDGGEGGE